MTKAVASPTFERLLKKAVIKSAHDVYKYSAMLIKGNRVISVGVNHRTKTHPISTEINPHHTIHAEVNAVVRAVNKNLLVGATIVVYREDKFGNTLMARPCETCQKLLKSYGIKKMIYTNQNGTWVMEGMNG